MQGDIKNTSLELNRAKTKEKQLAKVKACFPVLQFSLVFMCVASGVEINYFLFLHHSVPEDMTKFQPASYPIPAVCLSKLTSEQGAHEFNQVTSHPILSSQ